MEFVLYWPTTPEHFDTTRENPLKKTFFPFISWHQLQIISWLGMGIVSLPPLNGRPLSLKPIQVLCMLLQSMWVYMCLCPVMFGRYCFLRVVYHLCLLKYFCFLFCLDPWALRAGVWQRHPIYERDPKCLVLGFPVNSHLLQKDLSLKRAEWGTDLW